MPSVEKRYRNKIIIIITIIKESDQNSHGYKMHKLWSTTSHVFD